MIKYLKIFILILSFPVSIYSQSLNSQIFKLSKVLGYIDVFYVDTVNTSKLVEVAIEGMVKELDPHSSYLDQDEVKEMNEPLQGGFEGIGIQFNVLYDTIYVINPISGGPSEKVGIKAGDRIVKIENENVAGIGISTKEVRDRLMGPKGTKVKVSISRKHVDKLLDFTITRDNIPIYSLDASYLVDDSIGYIKLNQFSLTTIDEFYKALDNFDNTGFKHLILDLRNNGGGYLQVAFQLADEFLDKDKLIVYTQGINSPRRDYMSTTEGRLEEGQLIVLIDEGSASASEIVSGAIQDWDRGVIIGRRSFGKGLVQKPFNLPDGSMLKLTVAKYYTPTGRLIQKPYENGNKEEYAEDIINRYNNGELVNEDSIHFPDSLKFTTLTNKRIVYGGGGIMPDYFIPLDTTSSSDYYRTIIRQGILNRFILNYVDDNRKSLTKKYNSFDEFKINFNPDESLVDDLIAFAKKKEDLDCNDEAFEADREDVKLLIKAYIARDIWDTSEFYEIYNMTDEGYQEALKIMQSSQKYQQLIGKKK